MTPQILRLFALYGFKRSRVDHQSTQLHITLVDSFRFENGFEDTFYAKTEITNVILKHPLATNIVSAISFFNLEENDSIILCDALHIRLYNEQDIFLDPLCIGGINIGGIELKPDWEETNIRLWGMPQETYIAF